MKEYFQSPTPYVGVFPLPSFILAVLGIGSISTGDPAKIIIGIACLLVLGLALGWMIFQVWTPAVRIRDAAVEVRDIFGRMKKLDDVKPYQLVVSNTWIGFRRTGQQDVTIDKGRFSKKTWLELEAELRKLPVAGVI